MRKALQVMFLLGLVGCAPTPSLPVAATDTALFRGPIVQDDDPLHVALEGDAFFMLSEHDVPRDIGELSFSREGVFHFEFEKGSVEGTGTFRLVNPDGLRVMGWSSQMNTNHPPGTPPADGHGTDLTAFTVRKTAGEGRPTTSLSSVALQLTTNDVSGRASIDATGSIRVGDHQPLDASGNEMNLHLALVRASRPGGLTSEGGGYLTYATAAVSRGAVVDVWVDNASAEPSNVKAIVVVRDEQSAEVRSELGIGWY